MRTTRGKEAWDSNMEQDKQEATGRAPITISFNRNEWTIPRNLSKDEAAYRNFHVQSGKRKAQTRITMYGQMGIDILYERTHHILSSTLKPARTTH